MAHPHSLLVHQVELILERLRRSPQVPAMSFELDLGSTHHPLLGGPGAKGVEGARGVEDVKGAKGAKGATKFLVSDVCRHP